MLVAFARSRHGTEPLLPACPAHFASGARARGGVAMDRGIRLPNPGHRSHPGHCHSCPRLLDFGTDLASLFAQTPAPVPDEFPMAAPRQQSPLSSVNPQKGRTFMSNVSKAGGDDHNNATTRKQTGSSVESQVQTDAAAAWSIGVK